MSFFERMFGRRVDGDKKAGNKEGLPGVAGSTKPELKMPPTEAGQEELAEQLGITTHGADWDAKIAETKKRMAGEEGSGEGEDVDVKDL